MIMFFSLVSQYTKEMLKHTHNGYSWSIRGQQLNELKTQISVYLLNILLPNVLFSYNLLLYVHLHHMVYQIMN